MASTPGKSEDNESALSVVFEELISSLSHDLKTPPVVIQGFTELLLARRYGTLNANQEKALRTVHRNTLALSEMVDRLLDFSRLLHDARGRPEPIALAEAWNKAGTEAVEGCSERPFPHCTRHGDDRALVPGTALSLALETIAANVRRLAKPESPVTSVVRKFKGGIRLEIGISDPVEDRPAPDRLLEGLFQQGPSGAATARSPMGLAAARYFATLMEGRLESGPLEGGGILLCLTLPAADP